MDVSSRKKPESDFVVRLVGPDVRPWRVPFRALARVLDAVQRLVEQKDESEDEQPLPAGDNKAKEEAARILHLLDVRSSSAAYAVAAPDHKMALAVLSETGRDISRPEHAEWSGASLSAIRELSEVARSLGCEIEFREATARGRYGNVIAKITGTTYEKVSESAYIYGRTSVFARIERVGGATEMHCGIRLPSAPRKMVICRVASEDLVRELGQFMYQHLVLTGNAQWLRHNRQLKGLTITAFDPPKHGSILETLKRAHDVGGHAWDKIDDPHASVLEARGK